MWLPCEEHKKEISHRGITSIFFLLHLKIHGEFGLLSSLAGTMLGGKFVVHSWYHSQN